MSCIQDQPTEGVRPNARENGQIRPSTIVRAARAAGSQPHLASGFQGRCKIATLHAGFGVIRGMSDHISTSFAERQNLNVRMHTRRFTRLTNAFSKKVENHAHAVALFAFYYNFVRVHKTLRMTPAMAAGVTKRLWEISDVVDVLEAWEQMI
jgi:hypothetical protein